MKNCAREPPEHEDVIGFCESPSVAEILPIDADRPDEPGSEARIGMPLREKFLGNKRSPDALLDDFAQR